MTVINDILDFSKIDAGRIEIEYHPFDLKKAVIETVELMRPRAREKNLSVCSYFDPELPEWILGDVIRFKQVLANLVSNAVKFTGDFVEVRIESQTLKLFEVCRLRNIPIITFINKLDREGRDPFETLARLKADKTSLIITDGENLSIVRTIRIHTESAFDALPEVAAEDGGAGAGAASGPGAESAAVGGGRGGSADEATSSPARPADEASGDWVVVEDAAVPESEVPAGSAPASGAEGATEEADEEERTDFTSRGTPVEHRDFPFLHRVLVEVQRSLVRLRTDRPLGRVLITGGGSLIEGLPAALEDGLQAPVEWIDLRDSLPHDLSDQGIDNLSSFGTIALGLAAKGVGADPIGVDFRQDDFRYQKAFDQVKVVLSCCVCLVALLLFVILAIVRDRRQEAERPWQIMVTEARALAETALGRVDDRGFAPDAVQSMVGQVQAKNRVFAKKYGASGEFPPLESALDRLNGGRSSGG